MVMELELEPVWVLVLVPELVLELVRGQATGAPLALAASAPNGAQRAARSAPNQHRQLQPQPCAAAVGRLQSSHRRLLRRHHRLAQPPLPLSWPKVDLTRCPLAQPWDHRRSKRTKSGCSTSLPATTSALRRTTTFLGPASANVALKNLNAQAHSRSACAT